MTQLAHRLAEERRLRRVPVQNDLLTFINSNIRLPWFPRRLAARRVPSIGPIAMNSG